MENDPSQATTVEVSIVDAFVKDGKGGNPAGVVLDADSLSPEQMQAIAATLGLSETAFVSSHEEVPFRFDFFTPTRRIAHCGHATVGAFSYMAEIGRVSEGITAKMTVDGPREIIISNGAAFMEQTPPKVQYSREWRDITDKEVIASLGLREHDLIAGSEPVLINTGNSFVLVGVRDRAALARIKPDLTEIEKISESLDLIGYYVFALTPDDAEVVATTRMFAPRYGIPEEAATGMAAGPLACLLYIDYGFEETELKIEQGAHMKKPSTSLLFARLEFDSGAISGVMVGGYGKVRETVTVEL